jgi:hypothetical protein
MEASARLSCCQFSPLMPLLQRSLVLFAMAMAASVSLTAGAPAVAAPAASYRAMVLSVGDDDNLRVSLAAGRSSSAWPSSMLLRQPSPPGVSKPGPT